MSETNSTAQVEYRQLGWLPGYKFGSDASAWSSWKTLGEWYRMTPSRASVNGGPGYWTLKLKAGERFKTFWLHRLIAEAFHGPCPPGMEVAHNDGDKLNARPDNLRYATRHSNQQDRVAHGTHNRGERQGSHKLTADDVRVIRRRAANGELRRLIAADFGISKKYVRELLRRKKWAHLP